MTRRALKAKAAALRAAAAFQAVQLAQAAERRRVARPARRVAAAPVAAAAATGCDYVAIDGFELVGGNYGVRAVGLGYPADEHQRSIAVLNTAGHGQNNDPFFTGQSDWFAIQSCRA